MSMDCWIYRSPKKDEMYVYLSKEKDFNAIPELLLKGFGEPELVMQLTLEAGRTLAREDVSVVMQSLQDNGYYLQMPPKISAELYTGD